jgi:Protein of unknown function (DUF3093)
MSAVGGSYSETLRVPVLWWLVGVVFALAVWWVFFVVTPLWVACVAGATAAVLVTWAFLRLGAARVEAGDDGLRAGRALLPWEHIGPSVALDRAEARRQLGPEADARAYLLVRSYCPGAVKVYVDDESDPTPYWIVSSRRPDALADHLNRRIVQD